MKKIYIERVNSQSEIGGMIIDCDQLSFKFNRADGYLFATKTIDAKSSGVVLIKIPDWSSKSINIRRDIEFFIVKDFASIYEEFYQSKNGVLTIRQSKPNQWDFVVADLNSYTDGNEILIKSIIFNNIKFKKEK